MRIPCASRAAHDNPRFLYGSRGGVSPQGNRGISGGLGGGYPRVLIEAPGHRPVLPRSRTVARMKSSSARHTTFDETEQPTLRSLVEESGRGSVVAFRDLFERYQPRVYRYTLGRLGRAAEAEDAVQEVFLAVWAGLPTFRYEHDGSFP